MCDGPGNQGCTISREQLKNNPCCRSPAASKTQYAWPPLYCGQEELLPQPTVDKLNIQTTTDLSSGKKGQSKMSGSGCNGSRSACKLVGGACSRSGSETVVGCMKSQNNLDCPDNYVLKVGNI